MKVLSLEDRPQHHGPEDIAGGSIEQAAVVLFDVLTQPVQTVFVTRFGLAKNRRQIRTIGKALHEAREGSRVRRWPGCLLRQNVQRPASLNGTLEYVQDVQASEA